MTPTSPQLSRRAFLVDMGRGAFAIAVVGVAGCTLGGAPRRDPSAAPGEGAWQRLSLNDGFVSAFILVRSGEAAVLDVGGMDPVGGSSTSDILAALEAVGLGWGDVGHVILTHYHLDHAGSVAEVLAAAPDAQGYAGAEDVWRFVRAGRRRQSAHRRPPAARPGGRRRHRVRSADRGNTGPHAWPHRRPRRGARRARRRRRADHDRWATHVLSISSTEDIEEAQRSVAKLAALDFETLYVGHGEPIQSGAATLVREFLDVCPLDRDLELPSGCRFEFPGTDEGSAG